MRNRGAGTKAGNGIQSVLLVCIRPRLPIAVRRVSLLNFCKNQHLRPHRRNLKRNRAGKKYSAVFVRDKFLLVCIVIINY